MDWAQESAYPAVLRERLIRNSVARGIGRALIGAVYVPRSAATREGYLAQGASQEALHEHARAVTLEQFGNNVFVRAVVEISNYCRENCDYCGMRRDNKSLSRFRAHAEQLAELLIHHRPASVTDINVQAGEDPVAVREVALPLIRLLKSQSSLGISVCLGTLDTELYRLLREAGASVYIIKFETAKADHYTALGAPGNLAERLRHIRELSESGWKVSSGFIAGLARVLASTADGDTLVDELESAVELASKLPIVGCSVSPFVPGESTPSASCPGAGIDVTLNSMAVLRLTRPSWVIPAVSALNLAQPGAGYRRGLRCGANLVTINLTPEPARGDYLLYKRDRFIMTETRILESIAAEGLEPSTQSLSQFLTLSS